ncbi:MAG: hypothetical protein M3Z06_10330, partial [Actinomycetota bacterium]|nr:hypothetical protein [Actinomycetota bacterium]
RILASGEAAILASGEAAILASGEAAILASGEAADVPATGENAPMASEKPSVDLSRVAWLITVAALLVTDLILLVKGYYGYFGATLAVAISAAINLF